MVRELVFALLAVVGCSMPLEGERDCFRARGLSEAQLAVVQEAMDEWNARAGTGLRTGVDCTYTIVMRDMPKAERLGEWDGETVSLRPGTTGIPEADRDILRWEALHELGHALGLGHSEQPEDVMSAYHSFQTGLTDGDVAAYRLSRSGS